MTDGFVEVNCKPGQEFTIRVHAPKLGSTSSEAFSHFVAANKELLLALRSMVDAAIQAADRAEKKGQPEGKKRIKVE